MAAQTWPPSHRNLKPFHMPQVQHRTIGVQYPGRSGICKLFETLNSLKPGSRSGYKHVQVPQNGIYPRTPSALLLCSVSSPNHSHTCVSAHSGSLLLYCSRFLAVPGTHFAWIIWQHRLSEDLLSSPGTRFHMRGNLAKSSANPISHIHKDPQWQAAQASPDFHTNAHHSSTKINWASLCKYKGRWPCLPREAAGNPVVPKLQLHRSPCWSHSTCGLSSKTHRLCFRHPEPRSWVEKENK